ncbi:hypothetical protein O9992_11405 [Vibrio lentus]|nr:hypothetical protein [Vibrio lentus]
MAKPRLLAVLEPFHCAILAQHCHHECFYANARLRDVVVTHGATHEENALKWQVPSAA